MNDSINILSLLGIPSDNIQTFTIAYDGDFSCIYIELKDIRKPCPKCKSTNIGIKDYYTTRINNSIIKHQKLIVEVRMRRYVCKSCHATFKQNYDICENHASISTFVKGNILDDLKERLTYTQIAKDHNISVTTVMKIFDEGVLEQLPLPLSQIMCVDEFCHKHKGDKYHGKYPYVITNPITREIIDIVQSRWKSVLFDYFQRIPETKRLNVKYFVSDMNETSRSVKKRFFRYSLHIVDRFHIIKMFNDSISKIRTRIIKHEIADNNDTEARYLKKNWKIFLKDRDDLRHIKKIDKYGVVIDLSIELDACLKKYPDLFYAYWTKEDFRRQTKFLTRYIKAEEIINFYINKLTNSTIEEMKKIGNTFQNWKEEIINGIRTNEYSKRITNAIAEATNNQIQTLIDLSYGLPNFKRMRKRVIYINRHECLLERKKHEATGE